MKPGLCFHCHLQCICNGYNYFFKGFVVVFVAFQGFCICFHCIFNGFTLKTKPNENHCKRNGHHSKQLESQGNNRCENDCEAIGTSMKPIVRSLEQQRCPLQKVEKTTQAVAEQLENKEHHRRNIDKQWQSFQNHSANNDCSMILRCAFNFFR